MTQTLLRKMVTELIGTFGLVFTVCCTVIQHQALAPLAIGASLMVAVFAGGHISGAHYNPAVTLAVWLRGRLPAGEVLPYWAAQFVGAAAASGLAIYVTRASVHNPSAYTGRAAGSAFTAELIVTFALAYVVLNVATSKSHPNNSFYGLAIGFTVFAGAVAVGGISGGAFNPAVALGAMIAGLTGWGNSWIYLVACLGGAALAAFTFKFLNPDDK